MPSLVEHSAEALEEPSRGIPESFKKRVAMFQQIHTYTELRRQIHDDLRLQHPEWVQPNGESPMCDSYEARLRAARCFDANEHKTCAGIADDIPDASCAGAAINAGAVKIVAVYCNLDTAQVEMLK